MKIYTYFFITFFSFIGYYSALAIFLSFGLSEISRYYSVPIRALLTLMMLYFILNDIRFSKYIKLHNLFFWLFWLFYFNAIFRDWFIYTNINSKEAFEYIGYSLMYSIIPFMYFSKEQTGKVTNVYKNALLFSGFVLSLVASYLYGHLLLTGVGRISLAKYILGYDFDFISPLALSYTSSLVIGIGIYYLAFFTTTRNERFFLFLTIGISIVPFLLGASRGSVLSLALPMIHIFFQKGIFKGSFKFLIVSLLFVGLIFYLSLRFDSSVFRRTLDIYQDVGKGGASSVRIMMWQSAFVQFLQSPFLGDSVRMREFSGYPHNLFLEVLMSVGLYGFIPFLCLVVLGFIKSIKIIKQRPELTWIYILFAQGFIQHMFSGAVYSAIFFWGGIAMVFSVRLPDKDEKQVY